MRALVARYRRAVRTGQGGWALMDAIWSSVVVVLAFMGTFLAIDASTKTATRDLRKSTAYDLAQNELDRLRKLGDTKLTDLLAEDNTNTPPNSPNRTVTVDGVPYRIWNRAYYVSGIGTDVTDACGVTSAQAGNSAAQFVYLKVTVTWPGAIGGTTGSTGGVDKPASLETYFAPEGGDLSNNTGTLRVFLTRASGDPIAGRTVHLYKKSTGLDVDGSPRVTSGTGCVLFTGLARGDYEIRVPTTTEFDLYMTQNPVVSPIKIPARATLSRTLQIDLPVRVNPTFATKAMTGGPDIPLSTSDGSSSAFVGPWVAYAPEIRRDTTGYVPDEFSATGFSFMPHADPDYRDLMFPLESGYSAFAGPCDVNDPGIANRVTLPVTGDSTWGPNLTYTGALKLYLPSLRVRLTAGGRANTGKILVRLKNKPGSPAPTVECKQHEAALLNTWVRLPGTVDTTNAILPDKSYALPVGKYDICVRQDTTAGTTYYKYEPGRDNNNFPNPTSVVVDVLSSGTTTPPPECPPASSSLWSG